MSLVPGEELNLSTPAVTKKGDCRGKVAGGPPPAAMVPLQAATDLKEEGFCRGEGNQLRRPTVGAPRPRFGSADCPWTGQRKFPQEGLRSRDMKGGRERSHDSCDVGLEALEAACVRGGRTFCRADHVFRWKRGAGSNASRKIRGGKGGSEESEEGAMVIEGKAPMGGVGGAVRQRGEMRAAVENVVKSADTLALVEESWLRR